MNMETNVFANLSTSNVKGSVQHQLLEMCLKQSLERLESLVSDGDKLVGGCLIVMKRVVLG